LLVPEDLNPRGRFDVAEVDGLAEFEMAHVHDHLLGQSLGRARTFNLNTTCSSTPPLCFTPAASPTVSSGTGRPLFRLPSLHGNPRAARRFQRMVLDFLHQGDAVLARASFRRTDHQQVSETEW